MINYNKTIVKTQEVYMKKILLGIIVVIFIWLGVFIVDYLKRHSFETGNVSNVKIIPIESEIYSNEEINNAIDVILDYFEKNFNGCSLLEIEYIGDENNDDYRDWAIRNNKSEVIVFISNFKVNPNGGNGVLNSNSEYDDYSWILVRNENENWKYVDGGYG